MTARDRSPGSRTSKGGTATAETDKALREALQRLLHGTAIRTDGTLTKANLATEAGVSRTSLYRSPVLAEYEELVDTISRGPSAGHGSTQSVRLVNDVAAELRATKAELKQAKHRIGQLERHINGLLNIIHALQTRTARAGSGTVHPLHPKR